MKRRGAQGAPQAAASTATKQRRLIARKDVPKVVNDLRKSGPYFIGWHSFFHRKFGIFCEQGLHRNYVMQFASSACLTRVYF